MWGYMKENWAVFAYGGTSLLLTLLNKVFFSMGMNFPLVLLFLQSMVALLIFSFFAPTLTPSTPSTPAPEESGRRRRTWNDTLVAVLFVGNNALSMTALKYVSLPMFGALRRMIIVVVLPLQYALFGIVPSPMWVTVFSVFLICAGAASAMSADVTFSLDGYVLTVGSMFCAGGYLVVLSAAGKKSSYVELTQYNLKVASIVLALILGAEILSPQLHTLHEPDLTAIIRYMSASWGATAAVVLMISLSCILSIALNYSLFLTTTVASPITASIVGNGKALLCDIVGSLAFADVALSFRFVFGVVLTLIGVTLYSVCRVLFGESPDPDAAENGKDVPLLATVASPSDDRSDDDEVREEEEDDEEYDGSQCETNALLAHRSLSLRNTKIHNLVARSRPRLARSISTPVLPSSASSASSAWSSASSSYFMAANMDTDLLSLFPASPPRS